MSEFELSKSPHRRLNPLTGEWVLVSPHRNQRPWLGQQEKAAIDSRPQFDPECYLCPGNERAGGARNPDYDGTFVFQNDFSALLPEFPANRNGGHELLRAEREAGICRVFCFSPRHDLTLAEMPVAAIRQVVDLWTDQYEELGTLDFINHVQIFENKGAVMGCSNPHPHGQIWAQETIPGEPAKETARMRTYYQDHGSTLLSDYLAVEIDRAERIVCANKHFVALVPYWAVWPYELMVLCRRQASNLLGLTGDENDGLADIMRRVATRYDNLFQSEVLSPGLSEKFRNGEGKRGAGQAGYINNKLFWRSGRGLIGVHDVLSLSLGGHTVSKFENTYNTVLNRIVYGLYPKNFYNPKFAQGAYTK